MNKYLIFYLIFSLLFIIPLVNAQEPFPIDISKNNTLFVENFPKTGYSESAIPYGVKTTSNSVIKDAYIYLVPIRGLIHTKEGYIPDKQATVGFIVDFRVVLPRNEVYGYPKHYFSLESTSTKVEIRSGDVVKYVYSDRGLVTIPVKGDITASATINVKIREKIVDLKTVCHEVCDENGNCTTICDTYEVTYYRTHYYQLRVKTTLKIVKPTESNLYVLLKDGKPYEWWIFFGNTVSKLISENGSELVSGLKYFTVRKALDKAIVMGKGYLSYVNLKNPLYIEEITDSYQPLVYEGWVEKYVAENPNSTPIKIISIKYKYNDNVIPANPFGLPQPYKLKIYYLIKPQIKFYCEQQNNRYYTKLEISYFGKKYDGPVIAIFRTHIYNVTAKDGVVEFWFNRSGTLDIEIPTNLPDEFYKYPNGTIFVERTYAHFYVGEPTPLIVGYYQFILLLCLFLPIIAVCYVFKKIFGGEEDEEYL